MKFAIVVLFSISLHAQTGVNGAYGEFVTGGGGTTTVAAGPVSLTAANLEVCSAEWNSVTVTGSLADTAGNTYTSAVRVAATVSGDPVTIEIWYAKNVIGNASNTVTITLSSALGFVRFGCRQYSGADIVSPLDQKSSGNGASACFANSVGITPTISFPTGEILTAFTTLDNPPDPTPFAGTGFTLQNASSDVTNGAFWLEDQIFSSSQSGYGSGIFGSHHCVGWWMVAATFKPFSGSPTKINHRAGVN